MNKIYGDAEVIKRAKNARPGDTSVLINWDAISQLPDQYEVIVTEVKFNTKNLKESFSDVGNGTYMPTPALMYKIAEAKGIHGGEDSIIDAIYEKVDISEMTMAPAPEFQEIVVGYRCRKYSTVMEEDGTERRSSLCSIDYNVWNRVSEMWATEEESTDGYAKVIDGEYSAFNKTFNGPHYIVQKGKYQNAYAIKYGTKWARKKHFKSELKFAMQKAETKAHEKTIRELAGLMTGYKTEDLSEGRLVFAKVRRSREILQAESAARLSALSNGIEAPAKQDLLFGTPEEPAPAATPLPAFQRMIDAIDSYNQKGLIPADMADMAEKMTGWLEQNGEAAESNATYWPKGLMILKQIEEGIKPDLRYPHDLLDK